MHTTFTFNKSDDVWEWRFGDRPQLEWGGLVRDNYDNTNGVNNLIDSYSDLSYNQYQLTFGSTYNFTERLYANASFTYDLFKADEAYVYGDEDGTAYYGFAGVGWRF